jgi:hypothetical protein
MKDEAHRKEKKMMTIRKGREEPKENLIWGSTTSLLHLMRSINDMCFIVPRYVKDFALPKSTWNSQKHCVY